MGQEAGNQLVELLRTNLGGTYRIVLPDNYDKKRNQNSVILLRSSLFSSPREVEVPAEGWDAGDLLAVVAKVESTGQELTLASFHGDTNGLLTMPMMAHFIKYHLPTEELVFGLDANTYEKKSDST